MKKRVLVKISGGAIKGADGQIYDNKKLIFLCKQLATLNKTASVGLVLGGGNIWRGNMTKDKAFRRANADYMGMLSTVMNGLAFKETLHRLGVKAEIYSALEVDKITDPISINLINDDLAKGKIIIFVGGTGHPFFTTDTACAIRAIDMHADVILMGKDGVDGVYSDDPRKNKNAKFFKSLTFHEAISKELGVMDLSALTLCLENNIDIYVFDVLAKDNILKTYKKKSKFTHIHR
ncbi:MAG: UMP kinase [Mycoplasma sp.]|nr:UMP kinase [Candidatus Hennigella equi]